MFITPNVPTILQTAVLGTEEDKKLAFCKLHIYPFTYELAKELHIDVADRLFRAVPMPQWNSKTAEFEPCLNLDGATFGPLIAEMKPQRMEFRGLPEAPLPTGIIPGVEIRTLKAVLVKGGEDFTLQMGIRFEITNRVVAASYLVEQFRVTSYLTFQPMQKDLFEKQTVGEFANSRAKERAAK